MKFIKDNKKWLLLGFIIIMILILIVIILGQSLTKNNLETQKPTKTITKTNNSIDLKDDDTGIAINIEKSVNNINGIKIEKLENTNIENLLAMYDISVVDKNNKIINIENNNILITIPFDNSQHYNEFKIVYLDDENNVKQTLDAYYDEKNKNIYFKTTHLSRYGIIAKKIEENKTTTKLITTKIQTTKTTNSSKVNTSSTNTIIANNKKTTNNSTQTNTSNITSKATTTTTTKVEKEFASLSSIVITIDALTDESYCTEDYSVVHKTYKINEKSLTSNGYYYLYLTKQTIPKIEVSCGKGIVCKIAKDMSPSEYNSIKTQYSNEINQYEIGDQNTLVVYYYYNDPDYPGDHEVHSFATIKFIGVELRWALTEGWNLNKCKYNTNITAGQRKKIYFSGNNYGNISCSSSDNNIVTINNNNENAELTGVSNGNAFIKCKSSNTDDSFIKFGIKVGLS